MAENSNIEWTHHTFNPWIGCMKVSDGCKLCYAETLDDNRFSRTLGEGTKEAPVSHWGPNAPRYITSDANWKQPLKWNAAAAKAGERHRVFCASLADVFEDRDELHAPRARLFDLIRQTPHLDWLLLTKRPENIMPALHQSFCRPTESTAIETWLAWWLNGDPPTNVWIGTSVENQEAADTRIPHLLKVSAVVRFLSCEPLLGPVNLRDEWTGRAISSQLWPFGPPEQFFKSPIDWVIAGGESGPNARPMHPNWARGLRDQCAAAGVAFHFKQHGEWLPDSQNPKISGESGPTQAIRVGKKAAGRLLDGRTWDEMPTPAT